MKVTLKDGRMATVTYVGVNEEERTQSAIDVTFLNEIMGRLNNRGDLTPTVEDVINRCIQDRLIITPDTPEEQPRPAPTEQLYEEPAQPQTSQQRRSRTPVV